MNTKIPAIALAVLLLLTGCATYPAAYGTIDGPIVHKEYIPASIQLENQCAGAVPLICYDVEVLVDQCWRFDVRTLVYVEGDARRYDVWPTCVFPSEFDAYEVGDTYTNSGKVRYQ